MNSLPTCDDINPFRDLDGARAERDLLGKPVEAMPDLLSENSLHYQEHFLWMGPRAFVYYFPAAKRYLLSEAAIGDIDFANCMCGNLELRLANDWNDIRPSFPEIQSFSEAVLADIARFDIEPDDDVYGDLRSRYRMILERLKNEQGSAPE
jgi:hypothetical protein